MRVAIKKANMHTALILAEMWYSKLSQRYYDWVMDFILNQRGYVIKSALFSNTDKHLPIKKWEDAKEALSYCHIITYNDSLQAVILDKETSKTHNLNVSIEYKRSFAVATIKEIRKDLKLLELSDTDYCYIDSNADAIVLKMLSGDRSPKDTWEE